MAESQKLNKAQIRRARAGAIILPYAILWIYILVFAFVLFVSRIGDVTKTVIDMTLYISPLMCLSNLFMNYLWRLCKWHKLACILPLLPFLSVMWHIFINPFDGIVVSRVIHIVIFLFAIISSYKVYKQNIKRNATTS